MNSRPASSVVSPSVPTVAPRTTSLVKCPGYHPVEVRKALRRALDLLDSPERFIRPGDSILLKPNMLSAKQPERAVTTHPEIIVAVGEIVLDCRAKVVIGDSPAGMGKDIGNHWDKTGIAGAARRLGAKLVDFNQGGIRSFETSRGFVHIANAVLEADGIISLPKLKTHMLTRMTGAVKNMFGAVPGFRKSYFHSLAPEPLPFCRYVVAAFQQVVPTLNIMDAVVTMDGNGPSSGRPRHMGALLVSKDAFAIDVIAARLLGFELTDLPMFQAGEEAGLWDGDTDRCHIVGETVGAFQIPDFRPPDVSRLERIPKFVKNNLKRLVWIRPRAEAKTCNACGLCIDNCPQKAMQFVKELPRIDYDKCIKCGCCDEICPENAIYQQLSLLARLMS